MSNVFSIKWLFSHDWNNFLISNPWFEHSEKMGFVFIFMSDFQNFKEKKTTKYNQTWCCWSLQFNLILKTSDLFFPSLRNQFAIPLQYRLLRMLTEWVERYGEILISRRLLHSSCEINASLSVFYFNHFITHQRDKWTCFTK